MMRINSINNVLGINYLSGSNGAVKKFAANNDCFVKSNVSFGSTDIDYVEKRYKKTSRCAV